MLLLWKNIVGRAELLRGIFVVVVSSWTRGFRARDILTMESRNVSEGVEVNGEEMGSEISGNNRSGMAFHESQQ